MKIEIDDQDADAIVIALGMRICQIETGTTDLRAIDVAQVNRSIPKSMLYGRVVPAKPLFEIKPLSREQRDLITRMENLMERLRKK